MALKAESKSLVDEWQLLFGVRTLLFVGEAERLPTYTKILSPEWSTANCVRLLWSPVKPKMRNHDDFFFLIGGKHALPFF